jgi:serine/threonine protein kinase
MSEEHIKRIFGQLVLALQYLHTEKFHIVGSINLDSVYFDRHGNIRLSILPSKMQPISFKAPELLMDQPESEASDVWSLGVILYAMAAARLPFDDVNDGKVTAKIIHSDPVFPIRFSENFTNLLKMMLQKDPTSRITLSNIRLHPFLSTLMFPEALIREFTNFQVIDKDIADEIESRFGLSLDSILSTRSQECALYRLLLREKQTAALSRAHEYSCSHAQPSSFSQLQFKSLRRTGYRTW